MTPQEQVSRLHGLLERIKRNASSPRGSTPGSAIAAPASPRELTPPPSPVVSAADQSIDDLLGVSAQPSEPPLDVEVSLDSFAPPPAAAVPADAPDEEPIPLVALSTSQPERATADDAFALESEVSEVRVATGTREPAMEVTVAAIEAEAEPIAPEELSEDDLVEVTEGTPPPATASELDIDFEDEDERPPASSQRKVATTMDEALAAAAAQLDAEREVPLKTPPPESGPQESPPQPMPASAAPDVDALLADELHIPTREVQGAAPTPEQVGQTIDLEEAPGPSLELAEPAAAAGAPSPSEELEITLPGREASGGYDDNLMPPPEARDELEAHRRRLEDEIPPPPESLATLPSVQPGPAEIVAIEAAAIAPEVVARPLPVGHPETFSSAREAFRPRSFAELLDASLSLNGD